MLPSACRPLVAAYGDAEVPEEAALEVECAFGYPELTAVQLARAADVAADVDHAEGSWDPAAHGLPADLTDDLSKQVPQPFCGCLETRPVKIQLVCLPW